MVAARAGDRPGVGPGPRTGTLRLGFIGAGNYATSMLLPHLARDERVTLALAATTRALSATNVQRKFGVSKVCTDSADVLADDSLDAIFIVTRHHSHARFVCDALRTGKAVYVEKPLALTHDEVDEILLTVQETGNDRLMVGFNRRFAPLFTYVRDGVRPHGQPAVARYLVNAGRLASGSWYLNEGLEGSRFAGEGGHFLDALGALVDDVPQQVFAISTPGEDDVDVQVRFARGSVASVTYASNGNGKFPKETLDVSAGGRTARLENFTRASVWHGRSRDTKRAMTGQDKGQAAMLAAFVESLRTGGAIPISLDSLVHTTRATLAVAESAASGLPVTL
jgi:predicted dehydrogenase